MPEHPTRRLAAILFTDIVGYTALMQHDESLAVIAVNRHQEVLEEKVAAHQGEVLQYYGDGALSIFNSASEAVRCAMEIQLELQVEPQVPLRIGIHIGEILFENGKVFGDGVNIASRIESMGVPGAILFSREVYSKIRNRMEFQLVSLGAFEFKNVEEPVAVFAIANEGFVVPERETLEGKFKVSEIKGSNVSPFFRKNILWPMIVLTALVFSAFGWMLALQTNPLAEDNPQYLQIVLPEDKPLAPVGWQKFGLGQKALAISPDGKTLVYISFLNGNSSLSLRPTRSFEITHIPGTQGAYFPFWSPDSKWIGFFADGLLKKVSLSGGQPVPLAKIKQPYGASWGDHDSILVADLEGTHFASVPTAGGDPRIIVVDGIYFVSWPCVLPGGKYAIVNDLWGAIHIVSLASGDSRVLLHEAGWTPTYLSAGYILFAPPGRVMAVPFDRENRRILGEKRPVLEGIRTEDVLHSAQYSVSEKGTLAYVSGSPVSLGHLVWVNHSGEVVDTLPIPADHFGEFDISPDGEKIAYVKGFFPPEIWIYDRTSGVNSLFTTEGEGVAPRWGNNDQLIFTSTRDSGYRNLFRKSFSHNQLEQLTFRKSREQVHSESVFPDQVLAYSRQSDIWALNLKDLTKESQNLTHSNFTDWGASFSPGGAFMAFTSNEKGEYNIFVQPYPPTGQRWQISSGGGTEPLWSPSGTSIYFKGFPYEEMWIVEVGTKPTFSNEKPRLLFANDNISDVWGRGHDMPPDGKYFLMKRRVSNRTTFNEIHVITHWFTELERQFPSE